MLESRTLGTWAWVVAASVALTACHSTKPGAAPPVPEDAATCDARKRGFADFVAALPARAVASPTWVNLPASTLGAVPGSGPLVEVSPDALAIDGAPLLEASAEARAQKFADWVLGWAREAGASGAPQSRDGRVLYVAASADLDVHSLRGFLVRVPKSVELRLLVRVPAPSHLTTEGDTSSARDAAARLLVEPDPGKRHDIASNAYAEFAECPALISAISAVAPSDPRARWPALKRALGGALPGCDCAHLDTTSLRLLVSAEQRAGAATLGWLPLSFLRDERCDASMPLRSMKKLVAQMEAFDEQFSGDFEKDDVKFDDVLVDSRLRVNFCDALPGETLAAKARAHAALYVRASAHGACEPWTFAPMSLGTPMGTVTHATKGALLAFHYWQASEELRVFGPVDPSSPSKPTHSREWPCETTLHLTGIDDDAITVGEGKGRWFFTQAACEHAPEALPGVDGCVAELAAKQ